MFEAELRALKHDADALAKKAEERGNKKGAAELEALSEHVDKVLAAFFVRTEEAQKVLEAAEAKTAAAEAKAEKAEAAAAAKAEHHHK